VIPSVLYGLRQRSAGVVALDGLLDNATLNALLAEVLAITKVGRGWCSDCKKAVMVEVPDAKAVVSAMSELLVQAKGRPGPEADNEAHGLYQLVPDRVLAWREADFPTSATRFRRTLSS